MENIKPISLEVSEYVKYYIEPMEHMNKLIRWNIMEDSQRETMFKAWKDKHDREVKKCSCKETNGQEQLF